MLGISLNGPNTFATTMTGRKFLLLNTATDMDSIINQINFDVGVAGILILEVCGTIFLSSLKNQPFYSLDIFLLT